MDRTILITGFALLLAGPLAPAADPDAVKEKFDKAKAAYEAKAKAYRDDVLNELAAVDERAKRMKNEKLVERVAAEREQFVKYGTIPEVAFVQPHIKKMAYAQKDMADAYASAIRQFREQKLKPEADLLAEEFEAFKDKVAGWPDWCRPVARALGGKYTVTRAGGRKDELSLEAVVAAFASDPDFRIQVRAARDLAGDALTAVGNLRDGLKNPRPKAAELNDLLREAQRAVGTAADKIGNPTVRAVFREMRQRLEEPAPKGK